MKKHLLKKKHKLGGFAFNLVKHFQKFPPIVIE